MKITKRRRLLLIKKETTFYRKVNLLFPSLLCLKTLSPKVLCKNWESSFCLSHIQFISIISSFKVGLSACKKVGFISFNERSLKMTNNAFYFILKALFVLSIPVLTFLVMQENGLIRKLRKILKYFDFTNWNTNNYNKHIGRYLKK